MSIENWVSVTDAAALSGYSVQGIRLLARQGDIQARKIGKVWVVNKADLLRYKAEMEALGKRKHDPRRNPRWIESKRGKSG
jgi:hypothetical protein